MSEADADMELLKKHCQQLGEHFDTVQIFVTRSEDHDNPENRGTINAQYGSGNWFARYGQVASWLQKQDERTCIEARKEAYNDDHGD